MVYTLVGILLRCARYKNCVSWARSMRARRAPRSLTASDTPQWLGHRFLAGCSSSIVTLLSMRRRDIRLKQSPPSVCNDNRVDATGQRALRWADRHRPQNDSRTGEAVQHWRGGFARRAAATVESRERVREEFPESDWGGVSGASPGVENSRATLDTPATNPFLLGSYSYWRVGQYTLFSGAEKQSSGHCYFAVSTARPTSRASWRSARRRWASRHRS